MTLTKGAIRKEMAKIRSACDAETLKLKSAGVAEQLYLLPEFLERQNMLFYMALSKEVQTREMIRRALDMGKRVYIPVVDKKNRGLKIARLDDPGMELVKGPYGILEPAEQFMNIVPPSGIDFVAVPGVAFDFKGGRIGHGEGYYDRLLGSVPDVVPRVALAFEFQVLEFVPQESFDIRVRKIITEKRTLCC
ncbi:MAG: 5-formyltetrahydrofolate cyclo-ligase [Nitrospinae bacterium]|nr:5-formyltetrahydrofolate cyclo-ligase [Nitrospinota bacterium]